MKRSIVVDGNGGPLGVVVAGANVPDMKLLAATLDAMVVPPPLPTPEEAQHLCLDKGYDNPTGHRTVEDYGYTGHVRRIGEEKLDEAGRKTLTARRWVAVGLSSGPWQGSRSSGPFWCDTRGKQRTTAAWSCSPAS